MGLEGPESLGALFVADAPFLAAWAGDAPPLRDDTPGILTGLPFSRPRDDDPGYRNLTNALKARERFSGSPFIDAHWPPELRLKTVEAFDEIALFNKIAAGQTGHTVLLEPLLEALRSTRSDILPLLAAGGDPRLLDAALAAIGRGEESPDLTFWHGIDRLSHRDYAAAASLFARAKLEKPGNTSPSDLRALALCLAGDAPEARAEVATSTQTAVRETFWSETLAACPIEAVKN